MSEPYDGLSNDPNIPAISGKNTAAGFGVFGESDGFVGVIGQSTSGVGVRGVSDSSSGINGQSTSSYGVSGQSDSFVGVFGESQQAEGVRGVGHIGAGVSGTSEQWIGVFGESQQAEGVRGVGHKGAGVSGTSEQWIGVFGKGNPAGFFEGNVTVTGDITLTGADCAEEFDVSGATDIEPGTVMVLDQEGALQPSQQAYDKRVAGVISGAGNYKPGIVLDKQQSSKNRLPVALVGKVYCKVDAHYASIEVGDLLTTSDTPGHAMKADDPSKAFGSVIGKALRPLEAGQEMIPILIALQ